MAWNTIVKGLTSKPPVGIFKQNPVKDVIQAMLDGNRSELYRWIRNPRSGWTKLRLKRYPTSPDEANNPQVVRKTEG